MKVIARVSVAILIVCIFFVLLKPLVFFQRAHVYNFDNIDVLYHDSALVNICLDIVPGNKSNKRYVYINGGGAYNFKKSFFGIQSYGNDLDLERNSNIKSKFATDLKFIHSKGIAGICLPIDSSIKLDLNCFDKKILKELHLDSLYQNFKYICFTKKDIRMSFVRHSYRSDLYYFNNKYYFFSNF